MRHVIVGQDRKRRYIFKRNELKKRFYKVIQQNLEVNRKIRLHYTEKLSLSFKKDSVISKIRNRCIITGRGRSIYRDFRISRMQLRSLASFGYLMGVTKSSW